MIGQTISHYRILAKIGEGGMGVIYQAVDLRLDRAVALKFLPPSKSYEPVAKARFIQEAKAASALDHPNICTIYEINETRDGEIFIAMAYYKGMNLEEVLALRNPGQEEALDIIRQLASGLAQAHRLGIVHQDINPRNIIVLADGQVKLVDFGVAKLSGKSHVISQDSTMGTMAYMAPEQVQAKRIDTTTDVWALGALMYELLAGRKAFDGDHSQAVMYAVVNVDPPPIPGSPGELAAVLDKALQKNPRLRHKDAGEFLSALPGGPVAAPGADPTAAKTPSAPPRGFASRRVWLAGLVLLAAATVLGVFQLGSFRRLDFQRQDLLLITEFENLTGEEVFDGTISQALAYDLGQSPHVTLFTGRRLSDALERMERDPGASIDGALGLELAERENVTAVLVGSISRIDKAYLIGASLVNPSTGETVNTKSARANIRDEVFEAIDEVARNIRRDLGESLLSIERRDKALARVTTNSLQALRYYTQGEHHLRQADWEKATAFYQEAIAADSTFAIAYSKLGRIFFITARTNDALKFSARAMDHRAKLSDREKYYIEAEYFRYRADYDRAIEKFILLLDDHRDDLDVRMNLATTYMLSARYEAALSELQVAADIAPEIWYVQFALGNAFGGLGRYEEAREKFSGVLAGSPRQARTLDNLSWIQVCRGDLKGARAMQDTMAASSDRPSVSLEYRQARFHYFLGECDETIGHLQKALGEVRRMAPHSMEPWILIYRGLARSRLGNLKEAGRDFTAAVELWSGAYPRFYLGRNHIGMGDFRAAEEILATLDTGEGSQSTNETLGFAHRLRGLLHFHRGRFREAVSELELSARIMPATETHLELARANMELGRYTQAKEELRPLIDFPFVSYLEGTGDVWPRALALWGQVAEEDGNMNEAIEYYRQALDLWSAADEDHLEMRRTRIRLGDLIREG